MRCHTTGYTLIEECRNLQNLNSVSISRPDCRFLQGSRLNALIISLPSHLQLVLIVCKISYILRCAYPAYQGGENITTPYKKPRKGELTAKQKAENKEFSSQRIFVEHVIRLIKIFQIARQRFPLNSRTYEEVILTISGLVRIRIGALVLPSSQNL